jgi:hypothetical protein
VFEYGSVPATEEREDGKYPPFILSLLPLIVVIVAFNVIGTLEIALTLGFIVAVITLFHYIESKNGDTKLRTLLNSLNEGGKSTAESLF